MIRHHIKDKFISRHGSAKGVLLEFDLSQLEIAALAELSKDPVLIHEVNSGYDLHRANAAAWLRKPEAEVTDAERKAAKVISFQLTYGAGAKRIAETTGMDKETVQEFIDSFLTKYKKVSERFDTISHLVKAETYKAAASLWRDYVKVSGGNPTGRRYTIPIEPPPFESPYKAPSPTKLKNYPVQGFATGDLIPLIINDIWFRLQGFSELYVDAQAVQLVNTVHDSAMYDLTLDSIDILLYAIELTFANLRDTFRGLFDYTLLVNYTYEVKYGKDWHNMTKLTRTEVQKLLTSK